MALPTARELHDRLGSLPAIRTALAALAALADADGGELYVVGGTVRDLMLGVEPLDLDFVVGELDALTSRLAPVRCHDQFGTATVELDGMRCDLARARRETYRRPGALPEVASAGIEEDLGRRDFTVNALALGLAGRRRGELVAVPRALADLGERRLRVLHDDSFRDDPTRLLRLARYGARLHFAAEAHTAALARAAIAGGALETVSGPRIGAELELAALEDDPVAAFAGLRALRLDAAISDGFGIADPGMARRALVLLPGCGAAGESERLVMAAALLGVDEVARRPLLDRLGLGGHLRNVVLQAARRAPELAATLPIDGPPSALVDVIGVAAPETVALAGALGGAAAESAAARWLGELSTVALDIDGGDLIAAGMRPGPAMGRALRAALADKLDGRAATPEAQLAAALRAAEADHADG